MPAGDITATGRVTDKIKDLAERGVLVRAVDFGDPSAVRAAVAGADRVLLVSAMEPGGRVALHGTVISAVREAGTGPLAYTSIVTAATATIRLAADHRATQELLRSSGVPFVLLRNSWYHENYTDRLPAFLAQGAIPRISRHPVGRGGQPEFPGGSEQVPIDGRQAPLHNGAERNTGTVRLGKGR